MTAGEILLYDEFRNLTERAAAARRLRETYLTQAAQQESLAKDYEERADIIAKQLGFTE